MAPARAISATTGSYQTISNGWNWPTAWWSYYKGNIVTMHFPCPIQVCHSQTRSMAIHQIHVLWITDCQPGDEIHVLVEGGSYRAELRCDTLKSYNTVRSVRLSRPAECIRIGQIGHHHHSQSLENHSLYVQLRGAVTNTLQHCLGILETCQSSKFHKSTLSRLQCGKIAASQGTLGQSFRSSVSL